MKVLLISLVLFILSIPLVIAQPQRTLLTSYSETLSAGSSDTTTVSGSTLTGDSLGLMIEVNCDSVSGKVLYRYKTPSGYYEKVFASADELLTFSIGEQGVFSDGVPFKAGTDNIEFYVITKNEDSSTQTVTVSIYKLIWR